jgi:hypothetical protein
MENSVIGILFGGATGGFFGGLAGYKVEGLRGLGKGFGVGVFLGGIAGGLVLEMSNYMDSQEAQQYSMLDSQLFYLKSQARNYATSISDIIGQF